jgi:two-component system response regulator MprA
VRVLVVDDEPAVRDSLSRTLRFEGYDVSVAGDGEVALTLVAAETPDVVLLDVMMPRLGGLETCRRLRADGQFVPVLMLTARDGVGDRVAGLDAGADDYLVKPFALQELLARLRALLRRSLLVPPADLPSVPVAESGEPDGSLTFADIALDPVTREVRRHPRQVLTRPILFARVWGYDFGETSNSLHVYLGYLRRKLEAEGEPRLLHTVRGIGYVLREDPL